MNSSPLDTFLSSGISPFVEINVPRVRLNASLTALGEAYRNTKSKSVLLTNSKGLLAGILDDNAISRMSSFPNPATATAFDLLPKEPIVAVKTDAQMWEVLKVMNGENGGQRVDVLPVVAEDGTAIGVISRSNLEQKVATAAVTGSFPTPS
jgi:CBS domain-containing protein